MGYRCNLDSAALHPDYKRQLPGILAQSLELRNQEMPELRHQKKWIPQGWQWVDPEKEFKALLLAMRAGLMSRSEAISTFGYDAEDVDREIAADNRRADGLGLMFDSDPRRGLAGGGASVPAEPQTDTPASDGVAP